MVPYAKDVSVVVVSYNTRELLLRCLGHLSDVGEVIVVDNASSDGSADAVHESFPDVILIANKDNLGFGAANNQGIALASHPLVLLLNSDAFAEDGAISLLASAFADGEVVAAGGRLLNDDGTIQSSTANSLTLWSVFCEQTGIEKLFRPRAVGGQMPPYVYWTTPWIRSDTDVEQVMGACMMLRTGKEIFDERFFLYCEDTDLCRRLRRHGRIRYIAEARFTHLLGSSSTKDRWRSVARYNRGKELYFRIHHGRPSALACLVLNRLGALARLILWLIPDLTKRSRITMWWKVLTARVNGPEDRRRSPV
jgi:GT2 family glycosyltransferase